MRINPLLVAILGIVLALLFVNAAKADTLYCGYGHIMKEGKLQRWGNEEHFDTGTSLAFKTREGITVIFSLNNCVVTVD